MDIRLLTADDAPRYRRLMLRAYTDDADAFTSTAEERAAEPEAWWVRRIGGPAEDCAAFGALHDGALVGTAALQCSPKPKTRHRALLIGMYVLPERRGAGLGRALLETVVEHARARGVRSLVLTATDGNAAAIALYESAGFQRTGAEPMAIHTPSGFKAKVHMWKELTEGHDEQP